MRGAWIEIVTGEKPGIKFESLPMRGAWIEIVMDAVEVISLGCRSPCGERGLKLLL